MLCHGIINFATSWWSKDEGTATNGKSEQKKTTSRATMSMTTETYVTPFTPGFLKWTSIFEFGHVHWWKYGFQSKVKDGMANGAEPGETARYKPSHLDLQCLHRYLFWSAWLSQPRWLSWMRRPTGDQEVAGSTPAEVANILSWRLIMKYFLRSFSPFRWFKKGSCQFLAKECAQYWLTA